MISTTADRLAERVQRVEQLLLLADQIEAVAVAQMGLGPALAAGLLGVADREDDLVGARAPLPPPRRSAGDSPPDRRACTSSAHQSSLAVILTPCGKDDLGREPTLARMPSSIDTVTGGSP